MMTVWLNHCVTSAIVLDEGYGVSSRPTTFNSICPQIGFCMRSQDVFGECTSVRYATTEDEMMDVVGTVGPVVAYIHSNKSSFSMYDSEVYDEPDCMKEQDHAVTVVGYGTTSNGIPYWIIKNRYTILRIIDPRYGPSVNECFVIQMVLC